MKERPILFSGPMVNAILASKKTQTRRVIKNPDDGVSTTIEDGVALICYEDGEWGKRPCPYGKPGDFLWVRETWSTATCRLSFPIIYKADTKDGECPECGDGIRWRPSIFMRRETSRINLAITSIRVQRLQDISEEDAKAEGVEGNYFADLRPDGEMHEGDSIAFRADFHDRWDSLNAKRGFGWDVNLWVWVIEFRRIDV